MILKWHKFDLLILQFEIDFDKSFPGKTNNLFREWSTCSKIVMDAAKVKAQKGNEKDIYKDVFEISSGKCIIFVDFTPTSCILMSEPIFIVFTFFD